MKQPIVIFGDDPTGATGFGRVVFHLAEAAQQAGREPVVVGLKKGHADAIPAARVVNAPTREDPMGFETLAEVLGESKADTVVSVGDPWNVQGFPGVKEKLPFRWIACTPVDSTPYPRNVLLSMQPRQYLDVAVLLSYADRIVTYSDFGREAVEGMLAAACGPPWGTEQAPIERIYLGVDTELFKPRPKAASRTQIQGPVDEDTFLFSCMKVNSERAGFDTLLAAWVRFLEKASSADPALARRSRLYLHTTVEGSGHSLLLLIERYGIGQSVLITTGLSPDEMLDDATIADIHNASDVVVSAARAEGFGLNVLEAMSCSVPCVVPDYGGPAEYGGEGVVTIPVAAYYSPSFAVTDFAVVDVEAMAEAMLGLAVAEERREAVGAKARNVAETLTWDWFEEGWARLLR